MNYEFLFKNGINIKTKGYIKPVLSILIYFLFVAFFSQNALSQTTIKSSFFEVQSFKADSLDWDKNTVLILRSFDNNNKSRQLPATYHINNVIFKSLAEDLRIENIIGQNLFTLKANSLWKEWTPNLSLFIKKQDSIIVNFYLQKNYENFEEIILVPNQ